MQITEPKNYIFEFLQIGTSVKVTAVCIESFVEASIVVPTNLPLKEMKMLATKKVDYVKNKSAPML